ncbi:NAD(P)-binding Rossmann-fold containing protein [Penicillium nucicola]|uniref:NAD(P)-binding Rossmann-fold containing protein n=1 Tax=Penicillium nucicola TaxID=1850975 RepID=UPI0025452A0A|nr:NAD(P)-binding Rossmann-fold containing protein [Penicillium nucicola]KAJ5770048.1 NAD(P)-binding Rossmann-fold containing protein [Penicillium nucicola]
MSNNLVLITGGTGHIGFKTLATALKSGYRVRAAIRSESKKNDILAAPSIKALNLTDELTFIVVPDLMADGAYDEAVKDVDYIIHLASPIVLKGEIKPEDYESALVEPAVAGTINILKAAINSPSIKRVVITSSVVAMVPMEYMFEKEAPAGFLVNCESRLPSPSGPYPSDFHAYNASKIAALNATEAFVRDQKLNFDVVNIHPSFVIGKNELVKDVKDITLGTNAVAIAPVLGAKSESPLVGSSVHVNDIAFMHVKGLDPKVPAGSYIGNSDDYAGTVWQNATAIVAEHFPKAVENGVFPNNGLQPTRKIRLDARKTEEVMGFKFLSYEEQVKSVVGHYLELKGEKAE